MSPSSVATKKWFLTPWKLEKKSKHMAFVPSKSLVAEDGDSEVLQETLQVPTEVDFE